LPFRWNTLFDLCLPLISGGGVGILSAPKQSFRRNKGAKLQPWWLLVFFCFVLFLFKHTINLLAYEKLAAMCWVTKWSNELISLFRFWMLYGGIHKAVHCSSC